MKTHLSYIVIIAALLFFGWTGYKTLQKKNAEIHRLEGNVSALIADTTERASRVILDKKELDNFSPQTAEKVKTIERLQGGKVKEIQVIKYLPSSVVHDTVFVQEGQCCELQIWEFPHGCVTSIVTYDPFNSGITDSLFGEVTIDRYILAEKPRWLIVKPRYWFKNSWPTSVRVENNCGLQIKENTIFEIH